eukprot:366388-Amorphochlora_amoeboformis.AAC.1
MNDTTDYLGEKNCSIPAISAHLSFAQSLPLSLPLPISLPLPFPLSYPRFLTTGLSLPRSRTAFAITAILSEPSQKINKNLPNVTRNRLMSEYAAFSIPLPSSWSGNPWLCLLSRTSAGILSKFESKKLHESPGFTGYFRYYQSNSGIPEGFRIFPGTNNSDRNPTGMGATCQPCLKRPGLPGRYKMQDHNITIA